MNGIGIVFDIDGLKKQNDLMPYGDTAWRLFMNQVRPEGIRLCILREGDTRETLNGNRREFCISVSGDGLNIDLLKSTFGSSFQVPGLAVLDRRFILSPRLDSEPLVQAGRVNSEARLVVDSWSRVDHDRCKDTGWGYAPNKLTVVLSPDLSNQLEAMSGKRISVAAEEDHKGKKWWQFWR
jgi:hypothetical protein